MVVSNSVGMVEKMWVFIVSSEMASGDPISFLRRSISLVKYCVVFSSFDGRKAWNSRTISVPLTWFVVLSTRFWSVCHISTRSSMSSIHGRRSSVQPRWIWAIASLALRCHSFCRVRAADPLPSGRSSSPVTMSYALIATSTRCTFSLHVR